MSLSPVHNWYYRLRGPGLYPITPPNALHITSILPVTGRGPFSIHLHYSNVSALGEEPQGQASDRGSGWSAQITRETLGTCEFADATELEVNFILEGSQSFVFELESEKYDPILQLRGRLTSPSSELCDVVLFGNYEDNQKFESITDGQNLHNFSKIVVQDERIGTGDIVHIGSTVAVWYTAQTLGAQKFYENVTTSNGPPARFQVGAGDVIEGFDEGIIGMRVGGSRILTIPPVKAYGVDGNVEVPPNSTIRLRCQLIAVE